jgi:DNA-binding cell septation regulator SpoVG
MSSRVGRGPRPVADEGDNAARTNHREASMIRVSEVAIHIPDNLGDGRLSNKLRAGARIVIDEMLVINNIKIIEGTKGLFVQMPSDAMSDRCPDCRHKNPYSHAYCHSCGLHRERRDHPEDGRYFKDVVYPVTHEGRQVIHTAVMDAYHAKLAEAEARKGAAPLAARVAAIDMLDLF